MAAASVPLEAQDGHPDTANFCFRERPEAHCRFFPLVEFALSGQRFGRSQSHLEWQLGGMANLTGRHAVGATVTVVQRIHLEHLGINPRYRLWLGPRWSLDMSLGLHREMKRETGPPHWLVGEVGVRSHGVLGAFLHSEDLVEGRRFGLGLKLTSWLALTAGLPIYLIYIGPGT